MRREVKKQAVTNHKDVHRLVSEKTALAFLAIFLPCFSVLLRKPIVGMTYQPVPSSKPADYTFKVVRVFPHDPTAYTQGLAYRDGFLYEGTGLNGSSSLRKVRLESGQVIKRVDLPQEFFGEGITVFKDEIIQLTWTSQTGFIYNLGDFSLLRQFYYPGEGWGIATNGHDIFVSDGTPEVHMLDGVTLQEKRHFTVRSGSTAVTELNELEWVRGEIFANVWHTDQIARISPQTGRVVGWIDLTGLLSPLYHGAQVLSTLNLSNPTAHFR
jgi:glutaminyl-peptide cyclotransferase